MRIETCLAYPTRQGRSVTPLAGVRIETDDGCGASAFAKSHLSQVCGLKLIKFDMAIGNCRHTSRRCAD